MFRNAFQDKDREINRKRSQLEQLEAQKKNKLAIFGEHTANILKMIDELDNQGKFHRKPIGPLGKRER